MNVQVMKLISFVSYLIFSLSFILGRIIQIINTRDNEQELTEHIGQQRDNVTGFIEQQLLRSVLTKTDAIFCFDSTNKPLISQHLLGIY